LLASGQKTKESRNPQDEPVPIRLDSSRERGHEPNQ
jgi:hypothetical protein